MTKTADTAMPAPPLGDAGCDLIEDRLRATVRATIEAMFDEELAAFLGRLRYGRGDRRANVSRAWRKVKVDREAQVAPAAWPRKTSSA